MRSLQSRYLANFSVWDRLQWLSQAYEVNPLDIDALYEIGREMYDSEQYHLSTLFWAQAARLSIPKNLHSTESVYLRPTRHLYDHVQRDLANAAWKSNDFELCSLTLQAMQDRLDAAGRDQLAACQSKQPSLQRPTLAQRDSFNLPPPTKLHTRTAPPSSPTDHYRLTALELGALILFTSSISCLALYLIVNRTFLSQKIRRA